MQNHRENTRKYAAGGVLIFVLLIVSTAPVSAQAGATPTSTPARAFVTPTPWPAIQATAHAAQQRADEARASLQQAAQLEAQAAEMRRNAEVQSAQAAQAYSDARSAAAAQNAAAIGEAIGRGEAALAQLQASVSGQGGIVATLTARTEAQATTIVSLTLELQQVRTEKQTTLAAYTALSVQQAAQQDARKTESAVGSIAVLFVFVVIFVLLIAIIWGVIQNRRERAPSTPLDPGDMVDGEFSQASDQTPDDEAQEGTLGQ